MNLKYIPMLIDYGDIDVSLLDSSTPVETLWEYTNKENQSIRIRLKSLIANTNTFANEGYLTIYANDIVVQKIYLTTNQDIALDIPEIILENGKSIVVETGWDGVHSGCSFTLNGKFTVIGLDSLMNPNNTDIIPYTEQEVIDAINDLW
jgi:hypothetical protein